MRSYYNHYGHLPHTIVFPLSFIYKRFWFNKLRPKLLDHEKIFCRNFRFSKKKMTRLASLANFNKTAIKILCYSASRFIYFLRWYPSGGRKGEKRKPSTIVLFLQLIRSVIFPFSFFTDCLNCFRFNCLSFWLDPQIMPSLVRFTCFNFCDLSQHFLKIWFNLHISKAFSAHVDVDKI